MQASCQREDRFQLKRGCRISTCDARFSFCVKHDGRVAFQYADLRVTFQHQNASLCSFTYQHKRKLEKLCVPSQTRACELRVSTKYASLWAPRFLIRARSVSSMRPMFCY